MIRYWARVGTQQASRTPVVTTERVWWQIEADRPYWHRRTLASICTLSLATLPWCEILCVSPSVYLSLTDIDFWLMFSLSPSEHQDTEHGPRFLQTNTTIQHMFLPFSKRPPRYGTCFSVYPPMKTNCTCISNRDPAIANKRGMQGAGSVTFRGKAYNSACSVGDFVASSRLTDQYGDKRATWWDSTTSLSRN